MDVTVRVRALSKRYGATRVLDSLDLDLGTGVTGILGPNGAGKTTLLRCVATTLAPDSGEIRALGLNPADWAQRVKLRRRLGYLPQEPGYYSHFTAFELLDYIAILKELTTRAQRHEEVRRVLAEVELTDRATTKVRKLSGGMRQRLALAQALLGEPELLVLDEPTVGLDPEQRTRFRRLVSRIGEDRTVLLSTHQTEDVAALCERVVVMCDGSVLFHGTSGGLAGVATGHVWLADQAPADSWHYWRTADSRYRVLGDPPAAAELVPPGVEDGYLLVIRQRTGAGVGA